jgi:hypothetical protein
MLQSNQMLIQPQFAPAETKRNIWHASIPHSNKISDIFQPEFFTNVASQLLVGDRIECYAEDGTYFLELMVTAVAEKTPTKNANWANVVELRRTDLVRAEDKGLKLPDGFAAKWRGGAKWSVIRKGATEPEDQVIIEKQPTRADAIREFEKMKSKMVA